MNNEIIQGNEARNIILKGVNILADTIKITLGPQGKNVIISNNYLAPYITNDGATIAREINLSDSLYSIGAEIIKDVALRTNELVGDATTTATILAQTLINESFVYINKGVNGVLLNKSLNNLSKIIVDMIRKKSILLNDINDLKRIAKISCGNDHISSLIYSAYEEIGLNTEIILEESNLNKDELVIINGYKFDEGYTSSYFINNEKELTCEFDNPYFLITNHSINNIEILESIIEDINKVDGSLVIFSDEIDDITMSQLISLKLENNLKVVCIKSTSHNSKNDLLNDLAILVGANYYNYEIGKCLDNINLLDLGKSKKIKVFKDYTLIIEADGNKNNVNKRIKMLEKLINSNSSEFEKDIYINRLNRILSKTVILKIGANSKLELKEKKMKTEDAICATKAAIKDGISIGGGTTYLKCAMELESKYHINDDIDKIALNIMIKTLLSPFNQLLNNSAIDINNNLIKEIINSDNNFGYNIKNKCICDLYSYGIIDSTMAQIVAFESAVSIATTLITTECIVIDQKNSNNIQKEKIDFLIKNSENGLF